jgi:DNA-binding response OmpR family regulator
MNPLPHPKYQILVVDDDLELNTTFALMLEFDGHKVNTTHTGEAALQMLSKEHYDLLITEYWLPRMRGDELAALVKEQWPELPIIIVSADVEEINADAHPLRDVDCLLDKPFTIEHLREAMKWVFDRSAPHSLEDLKLHWTHDELHAPANLPPDLKSGSDDY